MGTRRGDSAVTRRVILDAARELFARRGVEGVSVRQIAAAAGVDHALVHRYFGTKREILAQILLHEAKVIAGLARPEVQREARRETPLASFRDALTYLLTEGRTSLVLLARAELDGMEPERLLEHAGPRPVALLAGWLGRSGVGAHRREEDGFARPGARSQEDEGRIKAMVLGAAVIGLATASPLLSSGAGLADADPDTVLRRCIDTLAGFAAAGAFDSSQEPQTG